MSLKGIRRKRWSERCDCRMHGATVWLLRLSRAFCVAPVSLEQRRDFYYVRISCQYAITSYIIMSIIGAMVSAGILHDIYHAVNKSNQSLWAHSISSILMFVPNYVLFCAVFTMGAFDGPARMERFINYFKRIKEISTDIEGKSKPERLEKTLVFKLMVAVIVTFSACTMKAVAGTHEVIRHGKSLIVQFLHGPIYFEPIIWCLLMMQVVFTITSVSWSLKSINKCIRQLHDDYAMEGWKTGHNPAAVNNIRSFCEIYTSLIKISKQVNAKEGRLIVILICNLILRLTMSMYYSYTSSLFKDKISRYILPGNISEDLSIVIIIATLVESCHTSHKEMRTTRILISQLLCCTESARNRVSETLIYFYKNTDLTEHVYVPLGVFEISRYFYLSLVSCLTTFFVIIHQFKLSD